MKKYQNGDQLTNTQEIDDEEIRIREKKKRINRRKE